MFVGVVLAALLPLACGGGGGEEPDAGELPDADGDVPVCEDEDEDGYGEGDACYGPDCDDTDPAVHPGAVELCGDEIDNNCDGDVDEGFEDLGEPCTVGAGICEATGVWVCSEDNTLVCDATTGEPEAERCNGLDDDCDGEIDEDSECACNEGDVQDCYPGTPETRGRGNCSDGEQVCLATGTWGACEGAQLPEEESCNGVDMDCNGHIDDVDNDGDTYWSCPGSSPRDCDDANPHVYPSALEECNGIDDNCNGLIDEEVREVFFRDIDGDTYGGSADRVEACEKPDGYAERSGDCNDENREIHPGAEEVCNGADDDCNGLEDDGLEMFEIYPDNDGDGFAPPDLEPREACDVPLGFALARDTDGDGTPDWDCNDTDATVNPSAAPRCDRVDNDCDGIVDRWCAVSCGGDWPVELSGTNTVSAIAADMDQDGVMEIGAGNTVSAALIAHDGTVLWRRSGGVNFARHPGLFADIDARGRTGQRALEWVVGAASQMTALRLTADGVEVLDSSIGVYDAGTYVARDLDGDDRAEIIAMDWNGTLRVVGWDPETDALVELASMPSPDGTPIYTNWLTLGDVDADGLPEIVFGTGYARSESPARWSGNLWAFSYAPETLTFTNACPDCYPTGIEDIFTGALHRLVLYDFDGDGAAEIRANASYFETNEPGMTNPSAGVFSWTFDAATGAVLAGPEEGNFTIPVDLNGDGVAENVAPTGWRPDVDGDGDLDAVGMSGGFPYLRRLEGEDLIDMPTGVSTGPGSIRFIGDLDNDDRLDVLIGVTDTSRLHCVHFGDETWNPWTQWGEPLQGPYIHRSGQLDPAEPNETMDTAYYVGTNRMMRGLLPNDGDADWYRVEAYCANVLIQAPRDVPLIVRTYAAIDRDGDGEHDLLQEVSVEAGARIRRRCSDTPPGVPAVRNRTFWVEIVGDEASSPSNPYLIEFDVSF